MFFFGTFDSTRQSMARESFTFGKHLREARLQSGLTQVQLARRAQMHRLRLLKIERGGVEATFREAIRLCSVLRISVQRLMSGRSRPATDLRGLAIELFHLGLGDLEVNEPRVPGALRRPEQVLVLALKGDRPEPRVVEAIPFVLAHRRFGVSLTIAFANHYDPRVRHRLAWLSDITLTLARLADFPVELTWERQLSEFIRAGKKPAEADSLGHPTRRTLPPVSRRWNITYAGELSDFLRRTQELHTAYTRFRNPPETEE